MRKIPPVMPVPSGWRRREVGEVREDGDQFFVGGRWQISCMAGHEVTINDPNVICADWKPKNFRKKTSQTFNHLSLVPSSILKGAKKIFHIETTKEKVQKYLKRIQEAQK